MEIGTVRRAYQKNPKSSSEKTGKATGRSRQAVGNYMADLRAVSKCSKPYKSSAFSASIVRRHVLSPALSYSLSTYGSPCSNFVHEGIFSQVLAM